MKNQNIFFKDDYGYFGKGTDGYVHYKQAFDRNFKGGGGKKPNNNAGCGTAIIGVLMIIAVVVSVILIF